jgi:hypothetical protein
MKRKIVTNGQNKGTQKPTTTESATDTGKKNAADVKAIARA